MFAMKVVVVIATSMGLKEKDNEEFDDCSVGCGVFEWMLARFIAI
jgi:hypothetical protein